MLDIATIPLDADYVIARFEEAGATLLAMPTGRIGPRMSQGGLEYIREFIESYGWTEQAIRPAARTSEQISRMDECNMWVQYIPNSQYVLRRIVGARSLVHPVTERHLFPWRRLGRAVSANHEAVKQWHARGIEIILDRLRQQNYVT